MIYTITLSDDSLFAVAEEKLEDAKKYLAKYSENGKLYVHGPYEGFGISSMPDIDPQDFD